jgi:N-acyl homoserine lactone hydrolase
MGILARTLARSHAAILLAVCLFTLSGCEQDLRVPYIPPRLANWPQPYHGVSGLKLHVFNTGYLRVDEAAVLRGGGLTRTRDLPVPAFLIEHPKRGLVLFNTGLSPAANGDSASAASPIWPSWLNLVRVDAVPGDDLQSQLQKAGFKPAAVRWIVQSNLRFDHTGELERFPNARVVVAKAEREYAQQSPNGYRPDQFDDVANWKFIDFQSAEPVATFTAHVDLFGDASCLLIDASGSTPGTMALLVRLPQQPVLLADDMAAVQENVRYAAQPAAVFDRREWWDHIWRLKKFKDLVSDLVVVPGHDLAPLQSAHAKGVIVHEFRPPEAEAHPTATPNAWQQIFPLSPHIALFFFIFAQGQPPAA